MICAVRFSSPNQGAAANRRPAGRTDADRRLFVAFAVRGQMIRVICARDMTGAEQERHEP